MKLFDTLFKRKDKREKETFIGAVYASPEIMMGNDPMFTELEENQTYPFIHSFSGSFFEDKDAPVMEDLYGSPQKIEEDQNSLGNNNSKDRYKFCTYCGNKLSNGNVCSSCGNTGRDADSKVSMACVYASPKMMKPKRRKKGF